MKKIPRLFNQLRHCVIIAMRSSKIFFLLRIISRLTLPFLGIANAFCVKYILDIMTSTIDVGIKNDNMLHAFTVLLSITLIQVFIDNILSYIESIHQEMITEHLQITIMEKSLGSDISLFDNAEYYDQMNQASSDINAFSSLVWTFFDFISSFITIISTAIIVGRYRIYFLLITVAIALPAAIIRYFYTKKSYQLEKSLVNSNRQKYYLYDTATSKQHAAAIRLYRAEEYLNRKYVDIWEGIFSKRRAMHKKRTTTLFFFDCMPSMIVVFLSLVMAQSVVGFQMTVGEYTLYTGQINLFLAQILTLVSGITRINDNSMRIDNVWSFQRIPSKVSDTGKTELRRIHSIKFVDVYFSYPHTKDYVIDNLSYEISSGDKIAIVGMNGSGKSTLIKLLLRLYDPDSGCIEINGRNIKEYTLRSLREAFACYFQNEPNYAFTLRENILLSDVHRSVDRERLNITMEDSGLDGVLEKAPDGADSYISKLFNKNGLELSGGEHQRLALARTFYRDSSVIILDEPSSSLDPKAENRLFTRLKNIDDSKIILFTSHHMSNLITANRIIYIEKGRIVESGDPDELLRRDSKFSRLFSYQTNLADEDL